MSLVRFTSEKQIHELTILYQFSNTMLSTIRLNTLTHLILSILTSESSRLFERAMLFLRNENSGALQGMLGVNSDTARGLQIVNAEDVLASRWEISDEQMALQRSDPFCQDVRSTRLDGTPDCSLIHSVIVGRRLYTSADSRCQTCDVCRIIGRLCSGSFAIAPLVSRSRSLGFIIVDNPSSGDEITREELHLLQLIANQAGMAIENSMLYNRVEDAHSSLRDAKERLVHGERLAAIGEMAANLAHELKNPLITIGGFAGRLLKGLPTESRESHYAETIVKEVGRLEKMLAEILAFSRKPTICYQSCNIASILKDCIENCQATLEDQSILCSVTSEDDLSVLGDGHQLKQAFLNLMLNACDAMPSGGRIGVVASRSALDKHSVRVIIRDSGGGIPVEMLPKIFNPFFTTKRHGTGLGLAIVNRIVTNHGGRIEAGNHGEGAEFTIILPMEKRHT